MKTIILLIMFIMLLVITASAQSQPPTPSATILSQSKQNKTEPQKTKTNNHQRGSEDSPLIVSISGTANTKTEISKTTKDSYAESAGTWLLILFNGLLALFTFLLYRSTEKLWQAGEKQMKITQTSVDLANKELILTQRPRLRVNTVMVNRVKQTDTGPIELFARGHHVTGKFYISNIGGMPAIITDIGCWVYWNVGNLPMERPYEGKTGNIPINYILNPGESTPINYQSEKPLDIDGTWITGNGSHHLYVMGWIEFRDALNIKRRFYFCRQYRVGEGRITRVIDRDYESYEEED